MPETFSDRPIGSLVGPCPLPATTRKETHWLEITLIGEDDQPIPWVEYLVELPDGTRAPGFLDGQGFARFSSISTSGICKVSFSKIDRDAWEFVSTQPAKETSE